MINCEYCTVNNDKTLKTYPPVTTSYETKNPDNIAVSNITREVIKVMQLISLVFSEKLSFVEDMWQAVLESLICILNEFGFRNKFFHH